MKKGIIAIAIVFAFAAAIMMGSGAIAQTTKSGDVKDTLEIKDPLFKKLHQVSALSSPTSSIRLISRSSATECHHVIKDGKNVWKEGDKVAMCSSCHKSPTKNEGKTLSLKNAFHKNCQGCHKKMKKGPKKCNQCHPKNSTGL
jgi:DnaJ-class molecular chaperone